MDRQGSQDSHRTAIWPRVSPALALLGGLAACLSALPTAAQTAKTPVPAKPAPAAPVSAEPASTSATYGDWVLRCQRIGEGDKAQRVCEVSQAIQAPNQRDPIAEVAIGRLPAEAVLRLTAVLPPNISFPSTVDVATAAPAQGALQLQWRRCLPGGCFAEGPTPDDLLKTWRAQTAAGRLTFKDAGGRDIAVPVSFHGLAQALDALAKD